MIPNSRKEFGQTFIHTEETSHTYKMKETEPSIVGNCDEFLYLGGNEQSTHKYVSELLGKATIDTNTYGHSYGSHGSYSTNDQMAGRELLTPDEVRMLDNQYALLFIRGERPIIDLKYKGLDTEAYENKMVEMINYFQENNYKVKLMSFFKREGDEKAIERICNKINFADKLEKYFYNGNIEEAIDIINSSEIIVGSRLHSNIVGIALVLGF